MKNVVLGLIGLTLVACGGGGYGRGGRPPVQAETQVGARAQNERREERRDDARDARIEDRTGWDKLGERMVDGRVDRDVIAVGKADGRFTRIMVVAEHSALEMFDIEVVFLDGTSFSPQTRLVFGKDSASRVIDLPGGRRGISKVIFKVGNMAGGGRAQLELWGK